jgi:hypothetical protein
VLERIVRAIRLDSTVFAEIAEDQNAMSEAAIIVVVVAILSALGGAIGSGNFFVALIVSLLASILIGWLLWAVLTYVVGSLIFKGDSDVAEMMRVLGYANAPRLLGLFAFIPCVGWLIALAGWLLSLVAGFLAVREAMDFDTGKAILTVVISWVIAIIINFAVLLPLGVGAAALGGVGF